MPASKDQPKRNAGEFDIVGRATLSVVAAQGDKPSERRFEIVAYTGEPLQQNWWDAPVIVDLEGIDVGNGVLPILDNHGPQPFSDVSVRGFVVGQSETAAVENGQLVLRGKMFDVNDAAKNIIALADAGFAWQASIGARAMQKDFIAEDNTVECNGRTYEGPVYISRRTVIREVSFVVIGADGKTSAVVAAENLNGDAHMKTTFSEYCKAKGFEEDKLTETQKASLMEMHAKEEADDTGDDDGGDDGDDGDDNEGKASAKLNITATPKGGDGASAQGMKAYRRQLGDEETRVAGIRAATAANPDLEDEIVTKKGKKVRVNIRAHAVKNGWSIERTKTAYELAELRASRAGGQGNDNIEVPNTWFSKSPAQLSEAVIEAAILEAGNCPLLDPGFLDSYGDRGPIPRTMRRPIDRDMRARYTDQVQQHAHELFRGRIGLQQVLIAGAAMNGRRLKESIRDDSDLEAALRANNWIRAAEGASTTSLANVLANVLGKYMTAGYFFGEMTWRDICGVRPTKDFKPVKGVTAFGADGMLFQRVGTDGQLKHAQLADQGFANQVYTEGRLLVIPRQILINDDLSILTAVPMMMGRGAILRVNDVFWTAWLAATTSKDDVGTTAFFNATHTDANSVSIGNTNVVTGGGSALSSAGLTAAELVFDKQIGPDLKPLGIDPTILLFPPDLKVTAWELLNSEFLVYGGASASKQPNKNRFVGAYRPAMSRYLSNSAYTGYSATAWYLLAEPGVLPAIEVAFLNGQETPTVQTAQADFSTLGIQVRGFFDVGVNLQNFRGAVRAAGA
jgi:hypothetical protein